MGVKEVDTLAEGVAAGEAEATEAVGCGVREAEGH